MLMKEMGVFGPIRRLSPLPMIRIQSHLSHHRRFLVKYNHAVARIYQENECSITIIIIIILVLFLYLVPRFPCSTVTHPKRP